ncbi:MAG: hypothetical protein ABIR56_03740, partial [Polaromonas sp.]
MSGWQQVLPGLAGSATPEKWADSLTQLIRKKAGRWPVGHSPSVVSRVRSATAQEGASHEKFA